MKWEFHIMEDEPDKGRFKFELRARGEPYGAVRKALDLVEEELTFGDDEDVHTIVRRLCFSVDVKNGEIVVRGRGEYVREFGAPSWVLFDEL